MHSIDGGKKLEESIGDCGIKYFTAFDQSFNKVTSQFFPCVVNFVTVVFGLKNPIIADCQ